MALSYDSESGYLTVDRTNASDASIPKFSRVACAQIAEGGDKEVNLRIFVDKSTIEVFAGDGRKVFTFLTFAAPGQDGVELFSTRGKTHVEATIWPMASIWH